MIKDHRRSGWSSINIITLVEPVTTVNACLRYLSVPDNGLIRAFAGADSSKAKYYDFDKDFLLELEPCSTHHEIYDRETLRCKG